MIQIGVMLSSEIEMNHAHTAKYYFWLVSKLTALNSLKFILHPRFRSEMPFLLSKVRSFQGVLVMIDLVVM
jgi:hypothetical protein